MISCIKHHENSFCQIIIVKRNNMAIQNVSIQTRDLFLAWNLRWQNSTKKLRHKQMSIIILFYFRRLVKETMF